MHLIPIEDYMALPKHRIKEIPLRHFFKSLKRFFQLTDALGASPVSGHPGKFQLLRSQSGMRATKTSMRTEVLTDVVKRWNQLLLKQEKKNTPYETTTALISDPGLTRAVALTVGDLHTRLHNSTMLKKENIN